MSGSLLAGVYVVLIAAFVLLFAFFLRRPNWTLAGLLIGDAVILTIMGLAAQAMEQ